MTKQSIFINTKEISSFVLYTGYWVPLRDEDAKSYIRTEITTYEHKHKNCYKYTCNIGDYLPLFELFTFVYLNIGQPEGLDKICGTHETSILGKQ